MRSEFEPHYPFHEPKNHDLRVRGMTILDSWDDLRPKSNIRSTLKIHSHLVTSSAASVAEWSKALRSGRSLFGGVGSNPTGCRSREIIKIQFCSKSSQTKSDRTLVLSECDHDRQTPWRNWIAHWTSNPEVAGSDQIGVESSEF